MTENQTTNDQGQQQPGEGQQSQARQQVSPQWQHLAQKHEPQPEQQEENEQEPSEGSEPTQDETEYRLSIPQDVPVGSISEEMLDELGSFAEVARDTGAPHALAQGAVEAVFDASAAIGGYGEDSRVNPAYSREHAAATLKQVWGDQYSANITKVAQIAASIGPKFQAWLDESGAGNDPRVCMAILTYPDMKLSKQAAAAELQKLMASKEYLRGGDKQLLVRAKVLGRLAYAEEAKPTRRLSLPPQPSAQETEKSKIRAELSQLIPKLDKGPAHERQAAKERFMVLTARL